MALGGLIDVEAVQVSRGYVEHRFRAGCKDTSLNVSGSVVGMELDVGEKVVLCHRLINIARPVASRYVHETTMGCVYALIPLRQAAFMNQTTVQLYDFHMQLHRLRDASRELSLHQ